MDTPDGILEKLLGEVTIEEFSAREYKDRLTAFENSPYKFNELLLQGKFSKKKGARFYSSKPILVAPQHSKETPSIVSMTPGICSSFAIWPQKTGEASNLFEACRKATLHPQFVFLALNWSTKLGLGKGKDGCRLTPSDFFVQQPHWSNFHKTDPITRTNKGKTRKPKFLVHKSQLSKLFENSIMKGAYLTDFVKGMIDSDSRNTYTLLNPNNRQLRQKWFKVFAEVLRNELDMLDEVFGIQYAPRFLIVFGPTLYNKLQALSQSVYKQSFEKLFPGRTVLYTGAFYSYRWRKRSKNFKLLRQLYYPSAAGPFDVSDFRFKIEQ